jgi:hypothetical protein
MFGVIAEPVGVMACGFIAKKQWKPLMAIYVFMLGAYFLHPFGRWLPVWTILDILLALVIIIPVTKICKNLFQENNRFLPFKVPLVAFIGTVTDALTRVFLLIPIGLYAVFGWSAETVYYMFVLGAADSYVEDILVIVISSIIGTSLIAALKSILEIKQPLS